MNSTRAFAAVAVSLLVHAGLIALAAARLNSSMDKPATTLPLAVQLVPEPEPEPEPERNAPAPDSVAPLKPPLPPKKNIERKPNPVAKPVATPVKPRQAPAPDAAPEVTPAPREAAPVASVAATPASPAAAPSVASAPPARTSVSIPASYAASNRKPAYPSLSRQYEEQGTVVLRVLVKADGTAGQIEIKSSSGHPLLDESAKAAVRAWRFNPATSDGKPVADWFLIPIPFTLRN
jgi:protein TonB